MEKASHGFLGKIKNAAVGENLKQRIILIILFAVLTLVYVLVFMPRTSFEQPLGEKTSIGEEITAQNPYEQTFSPKEGTMKALGIAFSDNSRRNLAEYTIEILNDAGDTITAHVFNADKVADGEFFYVSVPNVEVPAGAEYVLKISTNEAEPGNALSLYLTETGGAVLDLGYESFSGNIILIAVIMIIAVALAILFWSDKLHVNVLVLLLIFGVMMSLVTPIFDVPDEPEHFAKTLMMANGDFFRSHEDGGLVSDSITGLYRDIGKTLADTSLHGETLSSSQHYTLLGSGQFFFGYLPQAIGVFFAKLFGAPLLGLFYMGRIFNAICYAVLCFFAVRMAPKFKWFMAVMSILPMAVFISSSYNPDGLIYGLSMLLVAYFIKLYFSDGFKISYKQMILFAVLCALIAMKKYNLMPFCLLPLFLPASRFEKRRTKWISAAVVIAATLLCAIGIFFMISAMDMQYASAGNSSLSPGGVNEMGASMYGQLGFMLENPSAAGSVFSKTILANLGNNLGEMFSFGWMSYSVYNIFIYIYFAFLAVVAFAYTRYEYEGSGRQSMRPVSLISRVGILIIIALIIVATYVMLYLSWTPVGLDTVLGVQGRYFVPVLMLLPFLGQNVAPTVDKGAYKRAYYNIQFVAVGILAVSFITTVLQYY